MAQDRRALPTLFHAEMAAAGTSERPHLVMVRVTNVSGARQLYSPLLLCKPDAVLENALFRVEDSTARKLPYIGMRKKRSAPGFDAFLALDPGMSLQFAADLDTGWRFGDGIAPFRVRYAVLNPHPDPELNLHPVESGWLVLPG